MVKKFQIVTRRFSAILLAMSLCCVAFANAKTGSAPQTYRIQKQWNIGGQGGWGYPVVDPSRHLLYIPRTDRVIALDAKTGEQIGAVEGAVDARRIALDTQGKYGYFTDMTDGTRGFVRVFNRSTFALVASISTGLDPDAIVFEPVISAVFALNTHSHSVTVIDASSNQEIVTIDLPGKPSSAVADGRGGIFVSLQERGEILRLDAASRKIVASWLTAPCIGPSGLALDTAHGRVLSACENGEMIALNPTSGRVVKVTEWGAGQGNLGFDAARGLLFCADGTGKLAVLRQTSPDAYSLQQEVTTSPGARMLALDQSDGRVYLVTSNFGQRSGNVSEELQFRPTPVAGSFRVIAVGR